VLFTSLRAESKNRLVPSVDGTDPLRSGLVEVMITNDVRTVRPSVCDRISERTEIPDYVLRIARRVVGSFAECFIRAHGDGFRTACRRCDTRANRYGRMSYHRRRRRFYTFIVFVDGVGCRGGVRCVLLAVPDPGRLAPGAEKNVPSEKSLSFFKSTSLVYRLDEFIRNSSQYRCWYLTANAEQCCLMIKNE